MKRHAFNIAATLSMLLLIGVVVLWVRSYYVNDQFGWASTSGAGQRRTSFYMTTDRGSLGFGGGGLDRDMYSPIPAGCWRSVLPLPSPTILLINRWNRTMRDESRPLRLLNQAGFRVTGVWLQINGRAVDIIVVPAWFLILLSLMIPQWWIRARFKGRKRKGFCSICGYNLTANTSGICPECGTAIVAAEIENLKSKI